LSLFCALVPRLVEPPRRTLLAASVRAEEIRMQSCYVRLHVQRTPRGSVNLAGSSGQGASLMDFDRNLPPTIVPRDDPAGRTPSLGVRSLLPVADCGCECDWIKLSFSVSALSTSRITPVWRACSGLQQREAALPRPRTPLAHAGPSTRPRFRSLAGQAASYSP